VQNMDVATYTNRLGSFSLEKFHSHRILCDRVLDFQPGQRGVISNGKVCHCLYSLFIVSSLANSYCFYSVFVPCVFSFTAVFS